MHPLINRKKVKLSYRCFPNMCATISRHNKKILNNEQYKQRCQGKIQSTCPIPGKCATVKVIYRATVSTANDVETYVDLTAGPFKARFSKHKSDFFCHENERGSTTLSKHIWRLKDEGTDYQVRWEIVRRAEQFLPVTGKCNLCIEEKQEIIFNPDLSTLNSLRHKKKNKYQ